jgi:hypothetical protein
MAATASIQINGSPVSCHVAAQIRWVAVVAAASTSPRWTA